MAGELALEDIQGVILRGYTMPLQRHFLLGVTEATGARRLLARLTSGEADTPQIVSAAPWAAKPDSLLNIGITFEGLKALGLPEEFLESFPAEFIRGAGDLANAPALGYTGESDPAQWKAGLAWKEGKPAPAHLLLFLYAQDEAARDAATSQLTQLFAESGVNVLSIFDGAELRDHRVHFGYIDGIAQPRIEGDPLMRSEDNQPLSPPGAFLLGYASQYPHFMYPVPAPAEIWKNGSFAAYGILEQDTAGFEAYLTQAAAEHKCSKEWLAAKICGRWRNGIPISLSPDTDKPDPPLPFEEWNRFDFVRTAEHQDVFDDSRGVRCPIGSHIRRNNPRGGRVAGNGGHLHRLMRRGIPYGPEFDPASPHDGRERGLLGMFICVSLKDQFEFLMIEWVNKDAFGLLGDRDPLVGANEIGTRRFRIPMPDGKSPMLLQNLPRFMTTRGAAYCFLPSLTGLRYLAALSE